MRAAKANHYRTHQEILEYALDASPTNPQVQIAQIPRLATYMRNSVAEISQLSGICQPIPKQGKVWKITGEWLGKTIFLQLNHAPICPKCLQDAPYLRGEWHLSFLTVCWQHACQLIGRCPQCRRQLTLLRNAPEHCLCGFDLRNSLAIEADVVALLVSKLFANRSHGPLVLDSACLSSEQVENLAHLSLEGLCHTLWFLGHHLQGNFLLDSCSALRKLDYREINEMVHGVFWLLADWPTRLDGALTKRIALNAKWAGDNSTMRLLGPIQRYYETHIAPGDSRFITNPYETFVRQLVRQSGRKPRPSRLDSPQLELDFA